MPITPVAYTNRPYVSGTSLGELMRLRGQHAADAELRRGDIQAQMWSQLGQQIAGGIQNYAKEKQEAPIRAQDAEARRLQLDRERTAATETARNLKARDLQNNLTPFALKDNGAGVKTYDRDLLSKEFTAAGLGDKLPELFKGLDEADEATLRLSEAKRDALAGLAYGVHVSGNTPQAFELAVKHAIENGVIRQDEAEQYVLASKEQPQTIPQLTLALASSSPKFAALLKPKDPVTVGRDSRLVDPVSHEVIVDAAPEKVTLPASAQEYEYAKKNGYTGTYQQYQDMDANRRRPVSITNAANDDQMVSEAARNILANPRDLTSIRTITSLRGDQRLKLFNEIKRLNPDFNVGNIDRQVKFLDSYEDPKGRAAINRSSMNNILMHSADLSAVNQQYRRSNIRLTNTPIAALEKQSGTAWSQFATPLSVLKDEISLYFAGGYAPTVDQQKTWDAIVNDKATPAQVEQFAKDIIHVGLRRADTANQSFKTMMGYDDPNLITPDAVAAARALGLGEAVKKYGSGGQIGSRPGAAPPTGAATSAPSATGRVNPFRK